VDLSKFKTSDWLKIGGGAAMLIAGFLTWWKASIAGFGSEGAKAFDFFFTGTIPWLLLVAIGVLSFLAAAGIFKLPSTLPTGIIYLGASALALLLVIVRFLSSGVEDADLFEELGGEISRGPGLFIALLAAIAVVAGSFLGFKESGGDISDLTDMNKLKGQFGGSTGGGTPPPPPPPGMTPPPPPPPPMG
jgi:hypothetical protein